MGGCCSCCDGDESQYREQPASEYGAGGGGGQRLGGSGGGNRLGGRGVDSSSGVQAREAAAAAALQRRAAEETGPYMNPQMKEKREKEMLMGKIYNAYADLDRDAPIGLPASTLTALREHLTYVENLKRDRQRAANKEAQALSSMNLPNN
mmetsp:Transcript_21623/g.66119  ORF Transcript_21623/g.66119 Transcript_21623/m.66119 type:complete len:150 (-) Transcript_21623:1881-2330(-)